ncbi:MAG: tungstate ABC transporter substrate-binding protein WtpA [Methanoregula sp.]|jgi:molybdate/tungstate transport system substrate-binding protein|nr:tungstate ABC transporter substrate-binding protein WtpA [Methanoregula sp.]
MTASRIKFLLVAIMLIGILCLSSGCTMTDTSQEKTVLKVLPAGSLLQPFDEVEKEFEAEHPNVDVQVEGHGSIQVIRQVTDLHRQIDVVAVADASLIPDLMFRADPTTGTNFTDAYTPFARNAMVIAFTNKSKYAYEITQENWFEVLSRPDVRVGISNPMLDAAGYRSIMVTLLADRYYRNSTLFPVLIGSHFTPSLVVQNVDGIVTVNLPEVLRPSDEKLVIRDGSIFLLSHLESGGIDYAFEYRSMAEGHDLRWISLPPEIDLSSPDYAEEFKKVRVILGFQRFSAIGQERTGQPIVYAITIPNTAPNRKLAQEFADLVVQMAETGGKGWPAPLN